MSTHPSLGDWLVLSKARIQAVSLSGALLCAWMASAGPLDPWVALHLALGLTAVSSAAAAINQVLEVEIDRLMDRTRNRPLPTGRISLPAARGFAAVLAIGGVAWLLIFLNPLSAWLAGLMLVIYCYVYTPLKRRTPFNTVVGAVPGAMPLLVGWAAAGNGLNMMAGVVFAILFLWQFPHFFAIAWMYREDYERGGLKMLSNAAPVGTTARQGLHYAFMMFIASMLPPVFGYAGKSYFYGAVTLGIAFLVFVVRFSFGRSMRQARAVLISSIIYLPLLLLLLVLDYTQFRS